MNKYDYRKAMVNDIKEWILMNGVLPQAKNEEWTKDELVDWLYDEIWAHDCITGNGCYGYAPEDKCQEYIASNLELYFTAAHEFDDLRNLDWTRKNNPAQHMDATIRCYLLNECIWNAIEELNYKDKE